jgi:hypothetical protein
MAKKTITVDIMNIPAGIDRVFIPDGQGGSVEVDITNGQITVPVDYLDSLRQAGFVLASQVDEQVDQ